MRLSRVVGVALLSSLLTLSLAASAAKNPLIQAVALPRVAQDALDYAASAKPLLNTHRQQQLADKSLQRYFSPWRNHGADANYVKRVEQEALEQYSHFAEYYSFNFHHITSAWFNTIKDNMNLAQFPTKNQNAIIVHNTYLRTLPTSMPIYLDYRIAGQGYPFDNLQISSLWVGHPIHVYHISQDGAWALVQNDETTGWIKTADMAYVDAGFMQKYQTGKFVAITQDNIAVKNDNGLSLFNTRIGMLFPRIAGKIQVAVSDENQNAILKTITLDKTDYHAFPLRLTEKNLATLINKMLGEPYGWGGLYHYRDCSLTMRDLFLPFGLLLPRNSGSQIKVGQEMSLAGLSDSQKTQVIKDNGKPFFTLLHMPGHIVLYLGGKNGDLMIFQNKWGMATSDQYGDKGRAVIGQAHISPLTFGKNVKNASTDFLQEIDAMSILG